MTPLLTKGTLKRVLFAFLPKNIFACTLFGYNFGIYFVCKMSYIGEKRRKLIWQ
nr:MAG TPA: hypothetical protein [Caudoviricetes sp.]